MSELGLIYISNPNLNFLIKQKGILPVPAGDRLPRILGIVGVSGLQLVARVTSNGVLDSISGRDKFTWLADSDYWSIVGSNKSIVKALLNDISKNILALPPEFEEYPNVVTPFIVTSTSNEALIRFIERDMNKKPKPQPEQPKLSSLFMRSLAR